MNTLITWLIDNGYGVEGVPEAIAKSLASTSDWASSGSAGTPGNNPSSNNSSGFNGKPGGYRFDATGAYSYMTYITGWWAGDLARIFGLNSDALGPILPDAFQYSTKYGFSIRLIKDTTDKTHGQTGTYTGNDGTVYNTICIGTQEWMSENLKESQYRDTSSIPEVLGNTEWANDVNGARCYYIIP